LRFRDNDGIEDATLTHFRRSESVTGEVLTPILTLGNRRYYRIDVDNIPPGFGTTAFKLKCPRDTEDFMMCMVTAGSVGMKFSTSAPAAALNAEQGHDAKFDTIAPRCAWFVYEANTVKHARWDEEDLFQQAFMEEHPGFFYGGKFRHESWAKVKTSTVMNIFAVAGSDVENPLAT
jgi:hypothetical protein